MKKPYNFRINLDLLKKLHAYAHKLNRTKTSVIEEALEKLLIKDR